MPGPDFNLLVTLDVLLAEGSVAGAAKRLQLSPSAMSRALARLRTTTGDPLLVRAGRGLVPTPRAHELRDKVRQLVEEGQAILRPTEAPNLTNLERTFTIRTREGFVENFGLKLINRVREDAPQVQLHFTQKADRNSTQLREGNIDLETGVIGDITSPEIRAQALFDDHFIGVVRADHPLSRGNVTISRYIAGEHIRVARRTGANGPVDRNLQKLDLAPQIITTVGGFSAALALARSSDLIATVPERYTGNLRTGMHSFPLPLETPQFTVSLFWHPRLDADPGHRWLRKCVREICRAELH